MAIYQDIQITVNQGVAQPDKGLYIFKGDSNIILNFKLVTPQYMLTKDAKDVLINRFEVDRFELRLQLDKDYNRIIRSGTISNGVGSVILTQNMIQQLRVGSYTYQITLIDEEDNAIMTFPACKSKLNILDRLSLNAEEVVNTTEAYASFCQADAAIIALAEEEPGDILDGNGDYNKKAWINGDLIMAADLNRLEWISYLNRQLLNSHDNIVNTHNNQITNNTTRLNELQNEIVTARVSEDSSYSKLGDRLDGIDSQLAHITNDINFMSVESFGAKGDGVTNDTQAIQDAINSDYPIEFSNKTYIVDNINFNKNKNYTFRGTTIKTNTTGSEVATISAKLHFSGRVIFDANKKKNYALVYENGGRSFFENIECVNGLIYGLLCTSNRGGNVNINTFNQLTVAGNGTQETITNYTYVNETSIIFPKTIFRDTNNLFFKYVFEIDGTINPVKSFTEDANNYTLTFKEKISSTTPEIVLYTGGGLMLEGSDCGVFTFNTIDVISNKGVGVRITSLYGHTFNNLCIQGAYIGVLLGRYSSNSPCQGCVFIKPYFELISAKDFMTESADANIIVLEPIGGSCESLYSPGQSASNFILFQKGISNISKEIDWGTNPGSRTLKEHQFNFVSYSPNTSGVQSITLSKDDYCNPKFLFIGGGNAKPLKFTSDDGTLINGVTTYTLPVNNQMFRLVAVAFLYREWRIIEIGKCQTSNSTDNRPSTPNTGDCHYDTTLKKPIWWNGSSWIDATGTTV